MKNNTDMFYQDENSGLILCSFSEFVDFTEYDRGCTFDEAMNEAIEVACRDLSSWISKQLSAC